MRAIWQGILLASAVLIAGCATGKLTYVKAGTTEVERKRDESECLRSALDHTYRAHILIPIAIDRELYQSCLEARGYTGVRR